MSIRLSHKHGLNASISTCFWCGGDKNELVLFGRMKDDQESPKSSVINYEPCATCEANMKLGITLIEATTYKDKKPEIQKDTFPTGRWVVITAEAVSRIFEPNAAGFILKYRKAFMEPEVFNQFTQVPA